MSKLVAIDDGHGMETAGKRTPIFPGTNKFMHENEFNRAVADLLKVNLERCGFKILMVAQGDSDVPLKTRTDTANKAKADFYISIHANALNGQWGPQQGVSTYYYPGSEKGHKAAEMIHKQLIKGTKQKDRGILTENFHVLRETNMPAVLVECAFMDNLNEAQLLLTDSFRRECADEICRGICEYFGVAYVESTPAADDLVEYLSGIGIISDKAKWIQRGTADKDIYWLMRKTVDYIKKG